MICDRTRGAVAVVCCSRVVALCNLRRGSACVFAHYNLHHSAACAVVGRHLRRSARPECCVDAWKSLGLETSYGNITSRQHVECGACALQLVACLQHSATCVCRESAAMSRDVAECASSTRESNHIGCSLSICYGPPRSVASTQAHRRVRAIAAVRGGRNQRAFARTPADSVPPSAVARKWT